MKLGNFSSFGRLKYFMEEDIDNR